MYREKQVEFLLAEEDTITAYENKGKEGRVDSYEQGIAALSGFDRTQQVEALSRELIPLQIIASHI